MADWQRMAILGGTGNLGYGMAVRLAQAGHPVTVGPRDPDRARKAARRVEELIPQGEVTGASNEDAVEYADYILIAVPFASQASTLKAVQANLTQGQIVIDACVPLCSSIGGKPTQLVGVWHGSSAEQAAALVPEGVSVVSALHTLSADDLAQPDLSMDQDTLICGDRKADKEAVTALLGAIEGLRVIDAGRLEMSRTTESLTPLLIGINIRYKVHSGLRVTGI